MAEEYRKYEAQCDEVLAWTSHMMDKLPGRERDPMRISRVTLSSLMEKQDRYLAEFARYDANCIKPLSEIMIRLVMLGYEQKDEIVELYRTSSHQFHAAWTLGEALREAFEDAWDYRSQNECAAAA